MKENVKNVEPFVYHTKGTFVYPTRVTIVGIVEDGVLKISAARCSKKDNFERKIGRLIATDRLRKGEYLTTVKIEDESQTMKRFVQVAKIAADIINYYGVHQKFEIKALCKENICLPILNFQKVLNPLLSMTDYVKLIKE